MPLPNWTRPRLPILMLAVLPLALPACKGWAVSGARIEPPPPSLTAPCAAPVALPARAMSQAQVESAWGKDRTALVICAARARDLTMWANGVSRH